MIAFLDACIIIYWVEMAEPYYTTFADKMHRLHEQHGHFTFAASELSLLECRVKPMREKNEIVLKRYQQFFTAKDFSLVPINLSIIHQATELRVNYKLATPDALQAASALSLSDESIFITGDSVFKKVTGLKTLII